MGLQNAAYNGKVTNQVGQREKELCVRARGQDCSASVGAVHFKFETTAFLNFA